MGRSTKKRPRPTCCNGAPLRGFAWPSTLHVVESDTYSPEGARLLQSTWAVIAVALCFLTLLLQPILVLSVVALTVLNLVLFLFYFMLLLFFRFFLLFTLRSGVLFS